MQPNNDCNIKKPRQKNDSYNSLSWQFRTILGVNTSERINHQNIRIKLEINLYDGCLDNSRLDKNIGPIIQNYLSHKKPYLLERMAYDLATAIVTDYNEISWLSLTIEKPEALAHARCAYVTIRYGSP